MPDADIDPVADTVLHDLNFLRRLLTADQAGTLRKTFTLTNRGVRTLEYPLRSGDLHQQAGNQLAVLLHAGGENLAHQIVTVLINDQTGKPVSLTEHKTQSGRPGAKILTGRHGLAEPGLEPRLIDHVILIE